ncbi:DEAD/DEAH box helicase [Halapricum desulfuricans]|uniref:Distinct helicase family with a unique C-terminal domain including a metal-binding cysteine cluster n=1 Tax=Halapricum desulfuricans TaxID=2841257 RepID=A0A897MYB1_9EURY|nr:DEAD/DEAH box helicase [Halapricum desulfuricans]QSG05261.1 Distinct helicase family with a unique C-terminal domain including a metal-binding cysteine cluster [Halapricum desulfuricans]
MDETIDWLRDRPYYEGQIAAERTLEGREATFAGVGLDTRVERVLESAGIDALYRHQADAIEAVRNGDDVVLATPTASGKSLAYTVPAFERALESRRTTLYVAPQVALINDQAETLSEWARGLGFASGVTVDRYTGRLSKTEKREVRERQPTVLLTTPDMLHYGILPHAHRLWDWFFDRLETVVLDEVHEYRGVFGSQIALVARRLDRVARRFDSDPQYVCCSATIGNPVEHAATVTGRDADSFALVDRSSAATGPTHWLLWNPPEYEGSGWGSGRRKSSHTEAKRLFVDLLQRGLQTVVFTTSRQVAERYATESADALRERGEHDLASGVGAYQAALRGERRRELETGLREGSIRGLWSTNALELGVDIGGLDAVVLDGYPGTRMAAFQQAGRAGRGTDPALVALVAGEDQLDQYLLAHPDALFEQDPERAIANPENEHLLPKHVLAAARENWLSPDDDRYFGGRFPDVVADLESAGELDRRTTAEGIRWTYAGDGSPQHEMSLRTAEDREIVLQARGRDDPIATLPFGDALRDAHSGAIYHHQGTSYEVTDLDLRHDVATLQRTYADHYTQVLHDKEITVDRDREGKAFPTREDVTVRLADVTMHKQITGFERRDRSSGEVLGRETLDLPETSLETTALYYTLPPALTRRLETLGDFAGGIHAAEHAMISLFPFEFLCDRRDVGGLSTPIHPHTDRSTIFIYDGYPGGVGLAENGYEEIGDLASRTLEMLRACGCTDGCPACVQSPHCGNANEPLDKGVAIELLSALVE